MDKPLLLFKTSDIARLANVEQKRLEHWLERENIYLDGIAFRPGAKYRRFSRLDFVRVAIIARLNDFGIAPVKVASGLAEEVVDPYRFRTGNADGIPLENRVDIILRTLRELQTFFIFDKDSGQWRYGGVINHPGGRREIVGDEITARRVAYMELDAYLTINMQALMKGIETRLEESHINMEKAEYDLLKSYVDANEKEKK